MEFTYTHILIILLIKCSQISSVSLRGRATRPSRTMFDSLHASIVDSNAQEAIHRLSEVFEFENPPVHLNHRTPPEYMVDLYNEIAEPRSGYTKTSGPFDADVIRGLPDRATNHQMHFLFNVTFIKSYERILETEFHLFKLRPRYTGTTWRDMVRDSRPAHLVELRVYQVLEDNYVTNPDALKLLDLRRVAAHVRGWQVFKIGQAIADWLNDSNTNHGLLITAHSLSGRPVNGSIIRFAQRGQHHDRHQPVLVVFTSDGRPRHRNYITMEDLEFERQVQMLNEANWNVDEDDGQYRPYQARRRRSATKKKIRRNRKNVCGKHSMYVDFEKLGWSDWIISPKGYNAYQCKGNCPFPLGQNQKPTNHATVQSIVHALRIVDGVSTPCCVPNKLYSISLLFFDDHENVILKQYDDMVAATCGCH